MADEEYDSDDAWIREHAVLPRTRDDFRSSVMAGNAKTLRRRRWTRRGAMAAVPVLIVAIVAGAALRAPEEPVQIAAPIETPAPQSELPPGSIVIDLNDPESVPLAMTTATPKQRLAILKAVGDAYLQEYDDAATALPYYRQYVDGLPEQEQFVVRDSDTWLLAQLRESKRLEVGYAIASQ